MPTMEVPNEPASLSAAHRRRGPVLLMVIGALLLVAGASGFVIGSVLFGNRVADSASGFLDLRAKRVLELPVPGRDEVHLETGRYQVVAYGPRLVHRARAAGDDDGLDAVPFVDPAVTVTGPDGTRLPIEKANSTILSRSPVEGAVVIGKVSVTEPGAYRVIAQQGGPAVTSVGIRPSPDFGKTVGDAIGSGLIVVGGMVAGGLGLLVMVGGIVWLGTGDSRQLDLLPPPPGHGPPGPPQT